MFFAPTVNGLPLPGALVALIRRGRWVHPGEDRLREVIPFLTDPVVFLDSPKAMAFESTGFLADNPRFAAIYHEVRGRRASGPVELPWRDVDRSFFIAVNRWPGDDVGIALDYRTCLADPRVIASEWVANRDCLWREVAASFGDFARRLGLLPPQT